MKATLYILCLILGLANASPLSADDDDREQAGRLEIAIAFKRNAIKQFQGIAAKAKTDEEKIGVVARIAETKNEIASLTQALDEASGSTTSLSRRYRNALDGVVKSASQIIDSEKSGRYAIRARFLRGEAYRSLGDKPRAIADLKWAALQPDRTADSTAAALVAYDLLVAQGDYRGAISCMKNVDAKPGDAHYPLVLEYLAWSYYYQGDYGKAVKTLSLLFDYQRNQAEKTRTVEREQTYKGAGIFLASAMEEKRKGFTVGSSLNFLRKNTDAEYLPSAVKFFALGLSSKNLYSDIHTLIETVQKWDDFPASALLPIRVIELEQVLDLRQTDQVETAVANVLADSTFKSGDYRKLSGDNQKNIKKQLGRAANLLLQAKGKPREILLSLLDVLKDFSGSTVEERTIHRHNLAEVSFRRGKFDEATAEYRWIAENARGEMASEAKLKAIGARFESIKASGGIPSNINVEKTKDQPIHELAEPVREWLGWIERYEKESGKTRERAEPFRFEASRVLFSTGRFSEARAGFLRLANDSKDANLATLSAGAVLDSMIAAGNWEELLPQAITFSKRKTWVKGNFAQKAAGIAADAALQLATESYRAQRYEETLARIEKLSQAAIVTEKWGDLHVLAAHAALALEDKVRAQDYLGKVLNSALKPELKAKALLGAAALAETQFEFGVGASDYLKAFNLVPPKGDDGHALMARAMHLAWLSGDVRLLKQALRHPVICGKSPIAECAHYEALSAVTFGTAGSKNAVEKGKDAILWAMVGLRAKKISSQERSRLLEIVASGWANQDSITQFALLPSVPGILRGLINARVELGLERKMEVSKAALAKKAKAMERFEQEMAQFFDFPLTRVRVQALHEVARAYRDVARAIQSVAIPKELPEAERNKIGEMLAQTAAPFVAKQKELEEKAFVAGSRSSVNEDLFRPVSQAYFASYAEAAMNLQTNWSAPGELEIHEILGKVLAKVTEPRVRAWQAALAAKNWPAVASLMEEVSQKETPTRVLQRMKAASLSAIGEKAEAVAELEVLRRNGGEKDSDVCLCLLNRYVTTYAKAEAAMALSECAEVAAAAPALKVAVPWAGEELSRSIRNRYPASTKEER